MFYSEKRMMRLASFLFAFSQKKTHVLTQIDTFHTNYFLINELFPLNKDK